MIDLKPFGQGLGIVALQLNKPVSGELIRAYWAALHSETEPEEWAAFCARAAIKCGWTFLPTAPEMLDALREFRGAPSVDSEAVVAYDRVLESGTYTAESGTIWSFRGVREKCGPAAAEAFLAAGGHSAFATTWNEAERRERFVEAYQASARAEPGGRLLGAGRTLELGPGQ